MRTRQVLAAAVIAALAGGGAILLAAEVTGVSVAPTSLSIVQGGSDSFTASVDTVTGNIGRAPNAPDITYCTEWSIHGDGSVTCDATDKFALTRGRNYSNDPVTSGEYAGVVTVNVDGDAPCDQVYTLNETFTANSGSGLDFGAYGQSVTRTVAVTVTCLPPAAFGGCGHGFWKNHVPAWPVPYVENTRLGDVFDLGPFTALADSTFKEALDFKGGNTNVEKARILLRNAVAALLNAETAAVNYFTSAANLVNLVNAALATNDPAVMLALEEELDEANNLGSPFCSDPPVE